MARFLVVRRWLAGGLLVVTAVGYPIAWDADPYILGLSVLLLAPLKIAVALAGIVVRLAHLDQKRNLWAWLIDGLLIASVVAALAFLGTISWS